MMRAFFAATAMLVATASGLPSAVQADAPLTGKALLDALSTGGYVIYMRHTKTDRSQKDTEVSDLSNCRTQRNLSEEGKKQAKMMGEGFKRFAIKVDRVLSSPYCRAVDTAQIMLGRAQKTPELKYLTRLNPEEAKTAQKWLEKQLATPPAAGANTLLMSHTANLKKTTGIWPKNAGDINVFEPNGDGTYRHVGTITPDEWPSLMG